MRTTACVATHHAEARFPYDRMLLRLANCCDQFGRNLLCHLLGCLLIEGGANETLLSNGGYEEDGTGNCTHGVLLGWLPVSVKSQTVGL